MTDGEHPTAPRNWPTWPTPGIPIRPEAWQKSTTTPALVRSAGVVAAAFVLSRILGLAREIILSRLFGTSPEASAYAAAFRIPDLLFLVIMAGSFGSAFIPVFAGFMGEGKREVAWRLASTVLTLSAIAVAIAASLAFLFAEFLVVGVVAPGAPSDVQALTADTMRILLFSPVFLGLGIAAKGILEGQDRFDLPALAPVVYNLGTIAGALLLGRSFGVRGVAIGVVAGALGHVLIQIPGLVRSGLRYRPSVNLRTPGLSEVGRLLGPRIIGQAAFQVNFVVVTALAWRSGDEAVAAINYAWQLLMLPHGVLALSISTVVFPTMARLFVAGDLDGLRASLGRALKPLIFLSLPAGIALFFFRDAIVQTLFQGGAFDAESTRLVSLPLAWFAAGLLGYAVVEVLTRAFYAMRDTVTPVAAGIAIVLLNIGISATLVDRLGYGVLAFGLSFSTAVEATILLVVLRGRLGPPGRNEWLWLARVTVPAAAMALVSVAFAPPATAWTEPGSTPKVLQAALLLAILGLCGAIYIGVAWLMGIPEPRTALNQIGSRLPGGSRLAGGA